MDDHGGGTGSGGDDQVTSHPLHHLQHERPPNVISPLFLHPGEHPQHSQQQHQQQQNLSSRPVQQHRQHHHYESLASLILQHPSTSSSFGIEGECHTNNFKGDDNESWFQGSSSSNDDNDSIDSIDNTTALLNDGNRKRKLFRSFFALSDSPRDIIVGMVGVVTLGIILGLIFPSSSSSSASTASSNNSSWNTISGILGYTYFVSWTCSFYPQIITNWYTPTEARKGVSLDFCVWNIVGFVCYAIYTTSFRFSTVVREEYAHRFGDGNTTTTAATNTNYSTIFAYYNGNNTTTNNDEDAAMVVPQVQINDVAFAWHALLLATTTFAQLAWFSGGGSSSSGRDVKHRANGSNSYIDIPHPGHDHDEMRDDHAEVEESDEIGVHTQRHTLNSRSTGTSTDNTYHKDTMLGWTSRISPTTKILIILLLVVCLAGAIIVACNVTSLVDGEPSQWQWIDYLYFLSFVKVGISIVKYIPQVLLNYRRKSTKGWQIWNIILDFSGGTLSVVQLIGDSFAAAPNSSWTTGIVGNPAKIGLGLVSIFFDIPRGLIVVISHISHNSSTKVATASKVDTLLGKESGNIMSKQSPIDPLSDGSRWISTGFINDEFSAHCQEAQGRPFLLTGVRPTRGQRVELTIMLAPGQSGRGDIPFRLSGEVIQAKSMLNSLDDEAVVHSFDVVDDSECGGGGISSPLSTWHPFEFKDGYGINRGSVALAHVMRSLIMQQRPSLSVTPEHLTYGWKFLPDEKKAKVARAIVNKLGALHGDKVVCEVRLNFDYDAKRGTEDGPWNDGIPFDGRDIWQVTLIADDSMKNMWRLEPKSFVNLGTNHHPRCWPWSNANNLPYTRSGSENETHSTIGVGPNGAVSVHICIGPHGCNDKDHPHSLPAQAA